MLAVATVNDDGPDSTQEHDEYGESPIISVYDLESTGLKYVFAEPGDGDRENGSVPPQTATVGDRRRRFASVRFLYDNVFVAALAVDPGGYGGTVYYYSWRNSIVETFVRVDDGHVADVSVYLRTRCARPVREFKVFD